MKKLIALFALLPIVALTVVIALPPPAIALEDRALIVPKLVETANASHFTTGLTVSVCVRVTE